MLYKLSSIILMTSESNIKIKVFLLRKYITDIPFESILIIGFHYSLVKFNLKQTMPLFKPIKNNLYLYLF
jgi:hypothetical protein